MDFFIFNGESDHGVDDISIDRVVVVIVYFGPVSLCDDLIVSLLLGGISLLVTDVDLMHPFGVPDSDGAWDNEPKRVSLVNGQVFMIHLVCKNHFTLRI